MTKQLHAGDVVVVDGWPLPNGGEGEIELVVGAPPKIVRVGPSRTTVLMAQATPAGLNLWSEPNPELD